MEEDFFRRGAKLRRHPGRGSRYSSWGALHQLFQPGLRRSLEHQCTLYSLRAQDAL